MDQQQLFLIMVIAEVQVEVLPTVLWYLQGAEELVLEVLLTLLLDLQMQQVEEQDLEAQFLEGSGELVLLMAQLQL